MSLQFYDKCVNVSQQAGDVHKEAECYQEIGLIYEKQGDLQSSIECLQKFLTLCQENKNEEQECEAHKKLAEAYSQNDNISEAIRHLNKVLEIAQRKDSRKAQAEATLKLGLLYNKEGAERNMKKSADVLQHHFDLLRQDQVKDQNKMDSARVNLGIVLANQKIESYKHMVLNNIQGLVDWKVRRDPKHFQ